MIGLQSCNTYEIRFDTDLNYLSAVKFIVIHIMLCHYNYESHDQELAV